MAEQESTLPLSAVEHTHLMAFRVGRMGTLEPTAVVNKNFLIFDFYNKYLL